MVKNDHEAFFPPTQNCTLWRYVDLAKLLSILETRTLHFSRSDKLEDPYEGKLSKPILQILRNQLPTEAADNFLEGTEKMRSRMFVNCWCASPHESAAMWRLYVAIITDHQTLLSVLASSPLVIRTTLVKYVDYQTALIPPGNLFFPFVHKRLSFEHEHELRAVIWSLEDIKSLEDINAPRLIHDSIKVDVDPNVLIKAIYVSPSASPWFGELVERITRNRYGLACQVVRSGLNDRPTY